VDPQLGQYPAASLVAVAALPGAHKEETLLMADVGRKALRQVEVVTHLLERTCRNRVRGSSRICCRAVCGRTTIR
jgi:hypothetical protein